MKTFTYKLVIFLIICNLLAAQNKTDSLKNHEPLPIFYNYFYNQTPYSLNFEGLSNLHLNTRFLNDSSSIWIQTRMRLAGNVNQQDEMQNNLLLNILNPLQEKYADLQSMKPLKSILGAVQLSAVGYLAYLHLKKYGFLKRK